MNWLAKETYKSLEHLNLSDCIEIRDSNLNIMSKFGFCALRTLNLSRCEKITDEGISEFISTSGRELRDLCLRCCKTLTDDSMLTVSKICLKLHNLDILGVPKVTCKSLSQLSFQCRRLRSIDVSIGANIVDVSCDSHVPRFSGHSLSDIGKFCPRLESFKCSKATRFKDETGLFTLLRGCANLTTLSTRSCTSINDKVLLAISKNCHLLKHLDIGQCINVTDKGLLSLFKGQCCVGRPLATLITLNISGLTKITDKSIFSLAKANSINVTEIRLRGCYKITDHSIIFLASKCPNLRKLDLNSVENVSDISMRFISRNLWRLQWADFSFTQITFECFTSSINMMPLVKKMAGKLSLKPRYSTEGCSQHVKVRRLTKIYKRKLVQTYHFFSLVQRVSGRATNKNFINVSNVLYTKSLSCNSNNCQKALCNNSKDF